MTFQGDKVDNTPVAPGRSLAGVLLGILQRDLAVALRAPGQWLNPLLFFVLVITLFPLGIGPSPQTLATIAPGVIWVSALLAVMLSLDVMFAADFRDGSLEQFVLSGAPLSLIALGKVLAHWVQSGLPLLILSPLLAVVMQLPTSAIGVLMASLLLGTLSLSLIGAIGAALTVGVNQGGVLLSLLVLPLIVPVLIFGAAAVTAAASGLPVGGHLSLLGAILALSASLAPLAISAALRVGVGSAG